MVIHRRVSGLDELKIKKSGVYCIMPFSELDKNNKAIYKIGISCGTSFYNRLEQQYHTYFPMGFYYSNFLEAPTRLRKKRTNLVYYREIEKFIFDHIENEIKIKSNARINQDKQTEWFYCCSDDLKKVFDLAQKKYGGIVHNYSITRDSLKKAEPKKPITEMTIKFS